MNLISHRGRLASSARSHGAGQLGLLTLAAAVGVLAGTAAGAVSTTDSSWALPIVAGFALFGLLIVALLTDLHRVLLGLALIDLPFQWDVNLAYRADIASQAGLGGFNVSLTTLALTGLYAVWIARLLANPRETPQPRLRSAALPLGFLGILALTLVVARDRSVAGFQIVLIAQMVALFVYVASTIRTRHAVRFIAMMLLCGLLLNALVSLVGYVLPGGFHVPGTAVPETTPGDPIGSRLVGTFGAPNTSGAYLGFMATLAISLLLSPVGGNIRRLALIAVVPAVVALTLTLSRGAWIAFIVAVLVVMVGARGARSTRGSARAIIGIAAILIVVIVPLRGEITSRLNTDDKGSAASRVPLLHLAGDIIADHPLLGVGANNFAVVMPEYAGPAYAAEWLAVVHNKYLLLWAEAGLAALLLFLAFLWSTISKGWRARRRDDALLAAVALGLAAAVTGHIVHMCFDTFQSRPMTQTLWLAAAVIASPALTLRSREPAGSPE